MDIFQAERGNESGFFRFNLCFLNHFFAERRKSHGSMRVFVDIHAHKQCFGTFACVHMIKKLVDTIVRQQKSQYARVIFPCESDQSAIGSWLMHRGSAVQSLVSRSEFLQSESSATGCG